MTSQPSTIGVIRYVNSGVYVQLFGADRGLFIPVLRTDKAVFIPVECVHRRVSIHAHCADRGLFIPVHCAHGRVFSYVILHVIHCVDRWVIVRRLVRLFLLIMWTESHSFQPFVQTVWC